MTRLEAWEIATKLIEPLVEKHEIETYRTGAPFAQSSVTTKIDQHLEHILTVADWLLEEEHT